MKLFLVFGLSFKKAEQKCIMESLIQTGAIRKHGRPPPGNLERELGQWLQFMMNDEDEL